MPTVLREKGYRFFFFSREGQEPPHMHVDRAEDYAKFWLTPVQLAENRGFLSRHLREIREIIEANRQMLLEKWNEHHRRPH